MKKKKKKKISGNRAVRAGKGFVLFIWNGDLNDTIKIIKSIENSRVLIDGVTETVKHKIKKQESRFLEALLAHLAASVVQPIISLEIKGISERGVRRAGRGYMDRVFSSAPSFKQYQDF